MFVNFHENFSNLKIKKLKKERLLSLPPASILSSGHRSIITTRFSRVKNFHRMCLSPRQTVGVIIDYRTSNTSFWSSQIPPHPRLSSNYRRNSEESRDGFPIGFARLSNPKLIGFSFLETYLHFAEHVQRTYGTRLCTILLRLTKRKRGNNPISIHRDLRFLFLFLFLPSLPFFFTSTKISSG